MWTLEQARRTYRLDEWSEGYFNVNAKGQVVARPQRGANNAEIDLHTLTQDCLAQGLSLPLLIRLTDLLHSRTDQLFDAFAQAQTTVNYAGGYLPVYPIKVNQQHSVVAEILAHGADRVGLEAGSKAELMAVLGLSQTGGTIICNGYKDQEYIRLALIGQRLGLRVWIVIEKLSELDMVLDQSRALDVKPNLGVRIRLASLGTGKWQNSGGEKSKFGLNAAQVLHLIERLRDANRLDELRLLHCHLGSQVANIRDIQSSMREVARYFAELRAMGAEIATIDVGGGLGVDYEGMASRSFCSMNYTVVEYADKVVRALAEVSNEHALPHPDIITESGRAMTAHHAVLVTNVIDIEQAPGTGVLAPANDDDPTVIRELWRLLELVSTRVSLEVYHDAEYWLAEARGMYLHGALTLTQRARAESLYYAVCHRLHSLLEGAQRSHGEMIDALHERLADKYFCNLSIFQSVPDVWAIQQVFPIVPLHRLDDPPTRRAVLQDLTCDSDGKIDRYVERNGLEPTLPLHLYRPGEQYLLGIFMVGAYQEILGDMHNLFGDTDAVNVRLTDSGYELYDIQHGDRTEALLRYVHFDPEDLRAAYQEKIRTAELSDEAQRSYSEALEQGLNGYTYLRD